MNTIHEIKTPPIPFNFINDPKPISDGTLGVEIDFEKVSGGNNVKYLKEQKVLQQRTEVMAATPHGEPVPPTKYIRGADHHWLEKIDCDGHVWGVIVLQWNPGAKRWSRSGNVGSGHYITTVGWRYVAHCPIPEF